MMQYAKDQTGAPHWQTFFMNQTQGDDGSS